MSESPSNPWANNPRYFTECEVSDVAATKMLQHALEGVREGMARAGGTGDPIEIMGLLIGTSEESSIMIVDAFPLPVEGSETQVLADQDEVRLYMVNKAEALELTHEERLIGWYHSHPFDVGKHSNAFLSSTDIQTQFLWQQGLDPRWVAIVVDPLRSLGSLQPELGCFRVYPPHYKPAQDIPDGQSFRDRKEVQERWGISHSRYYALEVCYSSTELGEAVLKELVKEHLWAKVLAGSVDVDVSLDKKAVALEEMLRSLETPRDLEQVSDVCDQLCTQRLNSQMMRLSRDFCFAGKNRVFGKDE